MRRRRAGDCRNNRKVLKEIVFTKTDKIRENNSANKG